MGKALEVVTVVATPATSSTAVALTGNSLTVRDAPANKPIWMVAAWTTRQANGQSSIVSPLLHDSAVGITQVGGTTPQQLFRVWAQRLHPQDTLSVLITGGAAGDLAHLSWLAYYEDLPGVSARLITYDELMRRGEDLYGFTNTITTVSTTGQYTGAEAINVEIDQLKANREYAILGGAFHTATPHVVGYSGVDFGNLRVGWPGLSDNYNTNNWFADLAKLTGLPLIPVFNASNKTLTTIDVAIDENAGDPVVGTLTCLLS